MANCPFYTEKQAYTACLASAAADLRKWLLIHLSEFRNMLSGTLFLPP